jgi:hypothetical protein
MSIYTPDNAWEPPIRFTYDNKEHMVGIFKTDSEDENPGYIPALCRFDNGEWVAKVVRPGIYEQELGQTYPTPESWADADMRKYNEWLEDEYSGLPPLPELEKWVRDMNIRYHEYQFKDGQFILEET